MQWVWLDRHLHLVKKTAYREEFWLELTPRFGDFLIVDLDVRLSLEDLQEKLEEVDQPNVNNDNGYCLHDGPAEGPT